MVVEENGGKRGGVDLEFVFLGNVLREHGVEGVYAFENEQHVGGEAQAVAALFAQPRLEIIARQLYLLALQQGVHLLVEERNVHCLDILVVEVAGGSARRLLAVHEVVVERHGDRLHAAGHKLHREAFGEGGLAARRRTGYENDFKLGIGGDAVGELADFLFLQSLRHVDELVGKAEVVGLVEFAYGAHAEDFLPAVLLAEYVEHLALLHHGAQLLGVFGVGQAKQQPVAVGHDVKKPNLPRANEQ